MKDDMKDESKGGKESETEAEEEEKKLKENRKKEEEDQLENCSTKDTADMVTIITGIIRDYCLTGSTLRDEG